MSEPYVGEIRIFAGTFAPANWAFCDGSIQSIAQYDTLYALLGTTYGGDGQNTFGLPDLRGRVAVHQGSDGAGNSYVIGQTGGAETVTLTANQLAAHSHGMVANGVAGSATSTTGAGALFGVAPTGQNVYDALGSPTALSPKAVGLSANNGLPHDNVKPYVAISFIIALFGIFPSQS